MDTLAIRKLRILDGMYVSFRMLEHYHGQMYPACVSIGRDRAATISALTACWGFIDAMHRLRELTQATPGLGVKGVEVRRFLSATALAEDSRHYVQHLREELNRTDAPPDPVWGSLSWVDEHDPLKAHTAVVGAQLPGVQYQSAVFDRQELRWVSKVSLGVGGRSFNFDPLFDEAMRFERFVIPWLIGQLPGLDTKDQPQIISVTVQRMPNTALHPTTPRRSRAASRRG